MINNSNRHLRWFIALFIVLSAPLMVIQAEQKISVTDHDIHYMAFTSAMLTPEIAKAYAIQRSKSLGVVTVSVLKSTDQKAVEAFVRGKVRNPIGQLQELDFKTIKEDQAIYYLATFDFANAQKLSFDILVSPDGQTASHSLKFPQQLFID